jgi:hypothetical protein
VRLRMSVPVWWSSTAMSRSSMRTRAWVPVRCLDRPMRCRRLSWRIVMAPAASILSCRTR